MTDANNPVTRLRPGQVMQKRLFDVIFSLIGLLAASWLILLAWLAASIDTRSNGFFTQRRVGKGGRIFTLVKIKTMRPVKGVNTTVTRSGDPRVTPLGRLLRRAKIDELPQLINVLKGDMSFVGPRPDVPGYADRLEGKDRLLLTVRPGLTGPATLKYRNEEAVLAVQDNPERYNNEVLWPEKVRLNREYVQNWSFWSDIELIMATLSSRKN